MAVNMSPSDVMGRPGGGQPVPSLLLLVRSGRAANPTARLAPRAKRERRPTDIPYALESEGGPERQRAIRMVRAGPLDTTM